jgi:hypothetical protein
LHFRQVAKLRHSEARCFRPVQLKQRFFAASSVFLETTSTILSQTTDLCWTELQYTQGFGFHCCWLTWKNLPDLTFEPPVSVPP